MISNQNLSSDFKFNFFSSSVPVISFRKQEKRRFTNPQNCHLSSCTTHFSFSLAFLSPSFFFLITLSIHLVTLSTVIQPQMILQVLEFISGNTTEILAYMKFSVSFLLHIILAVLIQFKDSNKHLFCCFNPQLLSLFHDIYIFSAWR